MPSEFLKLKADMPVMGVGIGLRGEICEETMAARTAIDFLEFTPENYRDNNATIGWLSHFAQYFPFVTHSVSLSIGSIDPLDRDFLKMTRSFMKRFHLKWWSDHLCFTGVDGKNGNDLFPLPWTKETIKHVARKVREAQEIVEFPLILENIPFYTQMPRGDYDEAEFIANTLEEADCGMLLDLNNLFVNSINHKFDPVKFLDRLPLERVVQVHLAGPGQFGKRTIDTHGAPVPEPVFELLDYVLSKKLGVKAVMIERDQFFPKFDEILAELNHVRSIWERHNTAAGSTVPAAPAVEEAGSYSAAVPPPAVAEMPSLATSQPEPLPELSRPKLQKISAKPKRSGKAAKPSTESKENLSGEAVDPAIKLQNLAQFERRWIELWTEVIGTHPHLVDTDSFKAKFAHTPSGIEGFDLRAISVYTWLRDCNRDSLMRRVYPGCFELLKQDWNSLLDEYFYKFRPDYSDNRKVGDRFPEFVRLHCGQYQSKFPFLFEMVEFEQLKYASGRTHELTDFSGDVYLGSTEQIKSYRPLVNPELMIRSFIYPVNEIVGALQAQQSHDPQPLDTPVIFAFLPQSWSSKLVKLSGQSLRMIDQARAGNRSYSQLIAAQMTDAQRQSPQDIAAFIQLFQSLHKEKLFIGCIPLEYKEHSWAAYSKAVSEQQPHQTILRALQKFNDTNQAPGIAVDLGCGSGRDAKHMLSRGWKVFAVDRSEEALEFLRNSANGWEADQLTAYLGTMQDAPLPSADLINAGISLPFCPPDKFATLWKNVLKALKPGGRFSGHFFGVNDDWSVNKAMTFHTAAQVKEFFREFELEYYNEMEGPISVVPSGFRHGHIFEVVAHKL